MLILVKKSVLNIRVQVIDENMRSTVVVSILYVSAFPHWKHCCQGKCLSTKGIGYSRSLGRDSNIELHQARLRTRSEIAGAGANPEHILSFGESHNSRL